MSEYSEIWNSLPKEERLRLMPHMIESQIIHIEQTKLKAIRHHKKFLDDCNDQIKNLKHSLRKLDK